MARRRPAIAEAACVAALLAVYAATMAPSLTWAHHGADGGDLVTAVARGSIPHPPGFPGYLLLGALFIRLPWGDPAWRLNLMSAVLAAGAGGLTAMAAGIIVRLRARDRGSVVAERFASGGAVLGLEPAIAAGMTLGLAPLLWSQALIAEVYALAACCAALVAVLALRGGRAWVLGLAWGAGMGAHPVLIFLAPLVAWGAWEHGENHLRRLAETSLTALLGWGVMYGPVLLARAGVPSPWGDVSTFAGWWALVGGRLYHRYLFGLPLAAWPQRLLAWVGLLVRQFTPFGAVLAGLGWVHLWRAHRSLALASALAFGAFSLYAIGYDTADSLVYLVPALPVAALWLAVGLARAAGWLSARWRQGAWALLLLPLLQAILFWGQMDVSHDRAAIEWAERVCQRAPSRAVLLTAQDAHTFTLWYIHDVLAKRPDVVVMDRDLWAHDPYRDVMGQILGLGPLDDGLPPEEAARRAARPIVRIADDQ